MSVKFFDMLFGYERTDADFEESHITKSGKVFADRTVSGVGSVFTKRVMNSPIAKLIGGITSAAAHTPVKTYGLSFLIFGLLTLLMNLAAAYFGGFAEVPMADLITGAVFTVFSIPLLFIERQLCMLTEQVEWLEALLHDTLCIKRASKHFNTSRGIPAPLAVFLGLIPAVLGFFLPLYAVIVPLAALVLVVLAIFSPEFSFMLTLLAIPALPLLPHSGIILIAAVGLTTVSFFIKVLLGKRIYHCEMYDLLLLIFIIFILISGIFNKGLASFEGSLSMVALTMGYFLASNLIVNRRLADNAVGMILFSSLPTAVLGIVYYFLAPYHPEWTDAANGGGVTARAYASFGNPNVYAVFLIVAIVLSLTYALDKKRGKERIYYFTVFGFNLVAMVLTWTRGAWLALILSLLAYLVLHLRRAPKLLLFPLAVIPVALSFLPDTFIQRLMSIFNMADSSVASRLSIWRSSLLMLKDNIFTGVGVGETSFKEEFLKYAEDAVTAPHSHNVFLELACQAGIFTLAVFLFILLVRVQHISTYRPYIKSSSLTSPITMTGIAVFALLTFGMTDYIFYNSSMYFLFWVIFGLGSATLRIAKTEHDENIGYARYSSGSTEADTSIKVKD